MLLWRGKSAAVIAEYLDGVVAGSMGLPGNPAHSLSVANALLREFTNANEQSH